MQQTSERNVALPDRALEELANAETGDLMVRTTSPTRPRRHQGFSPGWRRGTARSERSSPTVLGLDDLDRSEAGSAARVDVAGARQGGAGSAFRGRKVSRDTPGRETPLYSHPGALRFPRSRPKSGVRWLRRKGSGNDRRREGVVLESAIVEAIRRRRRGRRVGLSFLMGANSRTARPLCGSVGPSFLVGLTTARAIATDAGTRRRRGGKTICLGGASCCAAWS